MSKDSEYRKLPDRQPVVAGRFYPSAKEELEAELDELFRKARKTTLNKEIIVDNIRAVISPHAGYIFSGQVAATAYLPLKNRTDIKRIFLIGSSHHAWFEGASVYYDAHYITPLGKIEIETEIARKLLAHGEIISYHPEAHANEHSLEVQLPFLQYILSRKFTIIPIIIGSQSKDTPYRLADILKEYFVPGNLFVISTDLSHYPEYYDAVKTDQLTIEALCSNNPEIFNRQVAENEKKRIPNLSTSICGWSSALTLLSITSSLKGVAYHPVLYQNSGDIALYGEKTRVVGYQSVLITVAQDEEDYSGSLSAEEKKLLLKHARESIEDYLNDNTSIPARVESLPRALTKPYGAFVSLYVDDKLRGCIGRLEADEAIFNTVEKMAVASASHDSRFAPIREEELEKMKIEISVLSPLRKISSIHEIIPGKHGILIRKGCYSGTFLPQVADKTGWDTEELLAQCSDRKAGLGRDGWKDAEIFIYEAEVFCDPA